MEDYHKMLLKYEASLDGSPAVKEAILLLQELRAMGIARGSTIEPFRTRTTFGDLRGLESKQSKPSRFSKI